MPYSYKQHLSSFHSQPITDSDLHIWRASLNASQEDLLHYQSFLSLDEKVRSEKFYFEIDRDHFIVGRGILRYILGGYLEMEPSQIEFVYGDHGKPALKPGLHSKVLDFNLSHSKNQALYAIGWNRRIGIDIEYIHPMSDMNNFAEQFFSFAESAFINALSGQQKEEAFFKIWTCKEAFLKANGSGLAIPLNQVEISLLNDGVARLKSISLDHEQTSRWHLEIFNPASGYQACLAVEGHEGQIVWYSHNL